MKTVISVPDDLFKAADRLARRLGISRSELFQLAIADYLGNHSAEVVRKRLDSVYGDPANRRLDPLVQAAAEQILDDEEWQVPHLLRRGDVMNHVDLGLRLVLSI